MKRVGAALARVAAGLLWAVLAAAAAAQGLIVLAPRETGASGPGEFVNVLGRTTPGATVQVAGERVPVYATGIFVRDQLPLQVGVNAITIEATQPAGEVLRHTLVVERTAPPPPAPAPAPDRLLIDLATVQPAALNRVAEGEPVEVSFRGTPGMQAAARAPASRSWQPLVEAEPGRYVGHLVLRGASDIEAQPVQLRLSAPRGTRINGPRSVRARSPGALGLWRSDVVRLVETGAEGASLTHGLHEVRLGGPFLTELPAGVQLRLSGQRGDQYRVRLAADTEAWVPMQAVSAAPRGSVPARAAVTSLSVDGTAEADVLSMALSAPVPWSVQPAVGAGGRAALLIDLFGTHHATTWITHLAQRRVVREVRVEQAATGRVRVIAELHKPLLWGWRVAREGGALRVFVRHPPAGNAAVQASPLQGLVVALEAGHGGPTNLGAIGATGVPEKDVNRWTTDALKSELERAGARVVDIREGDQNPPLRERARRVVDSGAHLFVSMHANAADTSRGYLRAAGTSTYYKHAHGRDLAAAVQRRVLEATALPDFGLVGNFNYAPIRLATWSPAILVEQAFMSHPGEEAQLLEPAFRERIARAVRAGLEDFLRDSVVHR